MCLFSSALIGGLCSVVFLLVGTVILDFFLLVGILPKGYLKKIHFVYNQVSSSVTILSSCRPDGTKVTYTIDVEEEIEEVFGVQNVHICPMKPGLPYEYIFKCTK